jgi:hypothetical protein
VPCHRSPKWTESSSENPPRRETISLLYCHTLTRPAGAATSSKFPCYRSFIAHCPPDLTALIAQVHYFSAINDILAEDLSESTFHAIESSFLASTSQFQALRCVMMEFWVRMRLGMKADAVLHRVAHSENASPICQFAKRFFLEQLWHWLPPGKRALMMESVTESVLLVNC